jgi:hypothetical protein
MGLSWSVAFFARVSFHLSVNGCSAHTDESGNFEFDDSGFQQDVDLHPVLMSQLSVNHKVPQFFSYLHKYQYL